MDRWSIADEDEITTAEHAPSRYLRVFTKDPSVRAFAELLDRALDKPWRQEQELKVSGEVDVVHRLMAARRGPRLKNDRRW